MFVCFLAKDEFNYLKEIASTYTCVINKLNNTRIYASSLFRLQYNEDILGTTAVSLFEECNATERVITLLTNMTTYDTVTENQGFYSSLAQSLELSNSDYKVIVAVSVSHN